MRDFNNMSAGMMFGFLWCGQYGPAFTMLLLVALINYARGMFE